MIGVEKKLDRGNIWRYKGRKIPRNTVRNSFKVKLAQNTPIWKDIKKLQWGTSKVGKKTTVKTEKI